MTPKSQVYDLSIWCFLHEIDISFHHFFHQLVKLNIR
uniref:Uncharacterized protein n=1 Tax=Ciona intestinalis TaxID=7719 RepID=H2XJS3_CIOIN